MITVKKLKELIKDLPDEAKCYVYEGEDCGINIVNGKDIYDCKKSWWISAGGYDEIDTYTTGFQNKEFI